MYYTEILDLWQLSCCHAVIMPRANAWGLVCSPCGWGAAGRRAGFVFAAVLPHDAFPHAMGRFCPSCRGGQYLFDVEKVPKDAMGLRPLVPPCIKKLCVRPWGLPPKPPDLVIHGSPALRGMTLCKPHEAESSAASVFLALRSIPSLPLRPLRLRPAACRGRRLRRPAGFAP